MTQTANQILNSLQFASLDSSLESDTRRMMRQEAIGLMVATQTGDAQVIKAAMIEAKRVANMWNVSL